MDRHRPRLLDQLRDRIRLKHYSIRTEAAYSEWVRRFVIFNGKRHPRELGPVEVEAFLTHLAVHGRVAASTQNQAKSAPGTATFSGRKRGCAASGSLPASSPRIRKLKSGTQ